MSVRVVLLEESARVPREVVLVAAPVDGEVMRIDGERWRVLAREHVVSTGAEASIEVTIEREGDGA